MAIPGDVAHLDLTRRGSDEWRTVPLARRDASGTVFFVSLLRGDYEGIVCVTRASGERIWCPVPIPGLVSVTNNFGGVNALFTV